MTELSRITVRPYRPGDEKGILATFNMVFREVCGPSYVDRTEEFWRWQFLGNPEGHRISIAVDDADGTVAAQYAGVPYRLATPYGDAIFVHIVDSFVHPGYRKGLKRPGLFVVTALPWFADCYKRGDSVPYGYPVRAADRIGKRYLNYNLLRVVNFLCRDLGAGSAEGPGSVEVCRVDRFGADVDDLYARLARERDCIARRTSAWLNWRFVSVPGDGYEIWEARRDGELCGVMVLRPIHELVPNSCTIADWMVPGLDDETTDALLARATARGRESGRGTLMTIFADPSPEFRALRERGFDVVPSSATMERRLTYQIYHEEMSAAWLTENWWYTLADSDLV